MAIKVSVIIPVRNRQACIGQCIESALSQDMEKDAFEVIVVDNGSTDRTAGIIRSYPVKYLYLEKPSISGAKNLGIEHASGEYVAFTDSDVIADKDWLRELLKGFDHPKIAGCGGKILTMINGKKEDKPWTNHEDYIEGRRIDFPAILGVNSIFRKAHIPKIGFFDEDDNIKLEGEDIDLSWRLHLAGYKFKYVDSAVIYHENRLDIRYILEKNYRAGKSNVIFRRKYRFANGLSQKKRSPVSFAIKILAHIIFIIAYARIRMSHSLKRPEYSDSDELFRRHIMNCKKGILYDRMKIHENVLSVAGDIIWSGAGDDIRIAKINSKNAFALNKVGSLIWSGILDSKPLTEIISDLERHYGIERCIASKDVDGFILKLQEMNFLEQFNRVGDYIDEKNRTK